MIDEFTGDQSDESFSVDHWQRRMKLRRSYLGKCVMFTSGAHHDPWTLDVTVENSNGSQDLILIGF